MLNKGSQSKREEKDWYIDSQAVSTNRTKGFATVASARFACCIVNACKSESENSKKA